MHIDRGWGVMGFRASPLVPHEGARVAFFLAFSTLAFAVVDVTRVPPCVLCRAPCSQSHSITTRHSHSRRVLHLLSAGGRDGGLCCHQRSRPQRPPPTWARLTGNRPPGHLDARLDTLLTPSWTPTRPLAWRADNWRPFARPARHWEPLGVGELPLSDAGTFAWP